MTDGPILVINTGSSSLKLGLYSQSHSGEIVIIEGLADGVGHENGTLTLRNASGEVLRRESVLLANPQDALREFLRWFSERDQPSPVAVGHRVVHGGPHLTSHQLITAPLLQTLRESVHFAPLHIPAALALIDATLLAYPNLPQFACFDTAFHRTMPEVATRFALPDVLYQEGVRRYGFHGLSYESILHQLGADLPGRMVIAHLGNGASLVAVMNGSSVDTSMAFTPTGGIPMATRSGDLDPGVLLHLLRNHYNTADELENLLNHDSGLEALSGSSGDMRDLEARSQTGGRKAEMAVQIFCRSIVKTIASYAAVLGGLAMLVFTGGIGEHSVRVRREVCQSLAFLGLVLDDMSNQAGARTISTAGSSVQIKVLPSQEDEQIARHCRTLLSKAGTQQRL